MQQLTMFPEAEVKTYREVPKTTVRLGTRAREVPLRERRKAATEKLKEVLASLEGKDILVSYCGGSHSHWWFADLKLSRLRVDWGFFGSDSPGVVVLWGTKRRQGQQSVRIFLNQLINVREQEHYGKYWLIDFWNGWGEYPIDPYKPKGYESLDLRLANQK